MKKVWTIALSLMVVAIAGLLVFYLFPKSTPSSSYEVAISIYGKDQNLLYDKELTTDNNNLLAILESLSEINLVTEKGQYGAFITSLMGQSQGDDYYWIYYVNGDYATVGVENYSINNQDKVEFRLEKYQE